jgi:hypothetical protein
LNNDEDDVATLDFFKEEFCHLWTTTKGQTEGTKLKKRKTKKRRRKGTKINQKSSTIFTSTN